MAKKIKFFVVGDIIGKPGRNYLASKLRGFSEIKGVDVVIANGENAAGGFSLTTKVVEELFGAGVNIITSGNHIWDNRDILKIIDSEPKLLRPANYPEGVPGQGVCLYNYQGLKIGVINLLGRVQMVPIDCPFRKFDEIYNRISEETDIIIVDFHAEATAEKRAFGWYVVGRASLVYGTHTHVQTADEEILLGKTAYITDIGMTGPFDSVIGMKKDDSIRKFLTQQKVKFEVAEKNIKINGVLVEIDKSGVAINIERVVI